jgi:hypothetical protein
MLLPSAKKDAQEILKKLSDNPTVFDWQGKLVKKPEP